MEFLKEKNNILHSLNDFSFALPFRFITIKVKENGGEDIYVNNCIDEDYSVFHTIDNLAKRIDKSKKNKINIYFLGNNEAITISKNDLKGKDVLESLDSDKELKQKVLNTIYEYKISYLSEILAYVEDALFFEKMKNINSENEIIKKKI